SMAIAFAPPFNLGRLLRVNDLLRCPRHDLTISRHGCWLKGNPVSGAHVACLRDHGCIAIVRQTMLAVALVLQHQRCKTLGFMPCATASEASDTSPCRHCATMSALNSGV